MIMPMELRLLVHDIGRDVPHLYASTASFLQHTFLNQSDMLASFALYVRVGWL